MNNKQKLELTWIGKNNPEYDIANIEPRILEERTDLSYGEKDTDNMIIHGDNLLALKALLPEYEGKVKCVYVDPPFNTGGAFEHYDDNVEHSTWLSIMKPRFELLKTLLKDDGVIFIQLDDSEVAYFKVLLDEIFGRDNYLNQITVSTNSPFGFKATSSSLFKQANQILLYTKDKSKFSFIKGKLFIEKEYDVAYKWVFENKDKPESHWTWRNINEVVSEKLGFESYAEAKKKLSKQELEAEISIYALNNADLVFRTASVTGGAFLKRKDTLALSKSQKDKIVRHPNDDMDYMFIGGERVLPYKERIIDIGEYKVPGELITDIWTDISIEGLASEGGVVFPKGKKPERIIQRCIDISTQEGDCVLDSFLGSGTTAAVSHKMKRRYIGIEMGEQVYSHVHKRLTAVVEGSDQSGISKAMEWKGGGGFKFYELAPSFVAIDEFGNPVIDSYYNDTKLFRAMCKLTNYTFAPSATEYWKQGKGQGNNSLYVTTQMLSVAMVQQIASHLGTNETLLICPKKFEPGCQDVDARITIKKIPQSILKACQFGKKEYLLPIKEGAMEEMDDEESDSDNN